MKLSWYQKLAGQRNTERNAVNVVIKFVTKNLVQILWYNGFDLGRNSTLGQALIKYRSHLKGSLVVKITC